MGVFEHFPYVNYHDMNLSWILRKLKELEDVIGSQIVDIVARAGVAENAQAIADLTDTVEDNATTAHNEATAASQAAAAAQSTANGAASAASGAQQTADNINTFLEIKSGQATLEPNITSEWLSVLKSGYIAEVSFSITHTGTWSNGWNTLFTLPATHQPTQAYEFDGVDTDLDISIHMQVSTYGLVRFYKPSNVTISNRIRGSVSFIAG